MHEVALAAPPPLSAYIQARYWGVGLLRRWTLAQAPQFLLALPLCVCAACAGAAWARGAWAWLRSPRAAAAAAAVAVPRPWPLFPPRLLLRLLPYTAHWGALVAGVLLCAHPQVVTRLSAASCPALYWFLASAWGGEEEEEEEGEEGEKRWEVEEGGGARVAAAQGLARGARRRGRRGSSGGGAGAAAPPPPAQAVALLQPAPQQGPQEGGTEGLFSCPRRHRAACRAALAVWVLGYTFIGGGLFAGAVNWT